MKIQYKPVIEKRNFDELKEGDMVICDHSTYGEKDGELIFPVEYVRYTFIHNHKYVIINDKIYMREALLHQLSIVVMKPQKSTKPSKTKGA